MAYSGEAVAVASMTVEQMSEYWAKYQARIPGVEATSFPHAVVTARILKGFAIGLMPSTALTNSRTDVLEVAHIRRHTSLVPPKS